MFKTVNGKKNIIVITQHYTLHNNTRIITLLYIVKHIKIYINIVFICKNKLIFITKSSRAAQYSKY